MRVLACRAAPAPLLTMVNEVLGPPWISTGRRSSRPSRSDYDDYSAMVIGASRAVACARARPSGRPRRGTERFA